MLAGGVVTAPDQQLLNAGGSAGPEALQADHQLPDVHRVEPVHILPVVDGFDHPLLIDVFREGKLDQDAVDALVGVEAGQHVPADPPPLSMPGGAR